MSPLKKIQFEILPKERGRRLDHFLSDRLPQALGEPLSKGKVRKLIVAGAVYLNGKRVRIASKLLQSGARADVFVDPLKLKDVGPAKDKAFVMTDQDVLYEDDYLIVVNKPYGLPTQPTLDEARDNLFAAVKKFLKEREKKVDLYLGLHHRLDRDTSGVILFAKAREANAGISELFSKHLAVKTYQALAKNGSKIRAFSESNSQGVPSERFSQGESQKQPQTWEVRNYLGRARLSGKNSRVTAVRSGGDFAHTEFKLLKVLGDVLWVEARPLTGRTHQIRVHLAEGGMPILGDRIYGGADSRTQRMLLHAACLTFTHPIHNTKISVHSPVPEDFLKCLRSLENPAD